MRVKIHDMRLCDITKKKLVSYDQSITRKLNMCT
jgi:hypothetical protein